MPDDPRLAHRFTNARTLVLVDDEASTGKTLINLTTAFKQRFPSLERLVTVVITDWRGEKKRQECHAAMPIEASSASLLEGQYTFEAAADLVAVQMPKVTGNGACKDSILERNYGRLGLGSVTEVSELIASGAIEGKHGAKHLVLGTGEFAYPPFLLAEQLEKLGFDVVYQSTTRSPIMMGAAIGCALTFTDNYEDGIPNFLYNASADMYDRIIICHETPAQALDPRLVEALQARSLRL
jgi:hypothetical protein